MELFLCETPHTRLHSAAAVVVENISLAVSSNDDCNLCFNCYSLYRFFRYGWMMMPLSCVEVRGKDWRKFNASWEWNWYRKKWFFMTFLFKINSRGWVSSCRIRKFRWGFFLLVIFPVLHAVQFDTLTLFYAIICCLLIVLKFTF